MSQSSSVQRSKIEAGIRAKKIDGWFKLGGMAIKWGTLFGCAWLLEQGWVATVGRTTSASLIVRAAIGWGATKTGLSVITVGALGWGRAERWLRRREIRKNADYIERLEKQIDPNRSTSGLTKTGATRREDRP